MDRIRDYVVMAGYTVHGVTTGEEALEFLRHTAAPQLILLDVTLPGRSGEDVLRQLNARPDRAAIKVFLASDWDMTSRLPELAADGFLRKPIALASVLSVIRSVLSANQK